VVYKLANIAAFEFTSDLERRLGITMPCVYWQTICVLFAAMGLCAVILSAQVAESYLGVGVFVVMALAAPAAGYLIHSVAISRTAGITITPA